MGLSKSIADLRVKAAFRPGRGSLYRSEPEGDLLRVKNVPNDAYILAFLDKFCQFSRSGSKVAKIVYYQHSKHSRGSAQLET